MIVQWESLHKNHNFATHIPICFSKLLIKVLINFIISSSWVHIRKRKLLGCQFQASDVINKPNLDVILHFDLRYVVFSRLRTSSDYISWFKKYFAIIQQLGPSTFFVTFTGVESKWIHLLECLYDLNS